MPTYLNNPNCPGYGLGTAMPDCAVDPKHIVGAILVPKTKAFNAADMADLIADLVTECQLDSKTLRSYPIFRFVSVTDESEAPVIQTLGYGGKKYLRDGKYDMTFQVSQGGVLRHIALRGFNNTNRKALLIDDDNRIFGVMGGTTIAPTLSGFSMDFFQALPWKPADGSGAMAQYLLRFAFSKPKEFNENLGIYMNDAGVDVEETVKGVMPVELENYGSITATTFKFKARTLHEKVNLIDSYSAAIVAAGGDCITVTNASTGAAITCSGIAADAANGGFTATITSSVGVTINVTLKGPATLAALGTPIGGGSGAYAFESDTIQILIPS